jgi:DUF4097 and DUF4098 domain-containing protein YvlB
MTTHTSISLQGSIRILISVFALTLPFSATAGEEIEETLSIPEDGLVAVENLAGSVEFVAWDRAEVQIRGEAGDTVEDVEIGSTASGVTVRIINRSGERQIDGTDLYLRVPEAASIEAETVSADISVSGSHGKAISLRTVSGDLQVDASPQRIELKSVSGDVEFEGSVPRSAIETVSGEIVVVGAHDEIAASTVSGDLSLEAGEVRRGRFEVVSGDLVMSLAVAEDGRLNCDSMSGDVRLSLPAGQQGNFVAQSLSGDIHSDFGKSSQVSNGPGVILEHQEGQGGAKIRAETFSGDVSIRRQ